MKTIEISLPDPLATFVTHQVQEKGFINVSEYLTALLQQEWQARQKEDLEAKLLEGLEEVKRGEVKVMTAADWERLRDQIRQRYNFQEG